jgi:hypothetical protein
MALNHVRLARQTGDHLNLLSISADDPSRNAGMFDCRLDRGVRPRRAH